MLMLAWCHLTDDAVEPFVRFSQPVSNSWRITVAFLLLYIYNFIKAAEMFQMIHISVFFHIFFVCVPSLFNIFQFMVSQKELYLAVFLERRPVA